MNKERERFFGDDDQIPERWRWRETTHRHFTALEYASAGTRTARHKQFYKQKAEVIAAIGQVNANLKRSVSFIVSVAHSNGMYDGLADGWDLSEYRNWLERNWRLKWIMRDMRDHPAEEDAPTKMCKRIDAAYRKRFSRRPFSGKEGDQRSTQAGWKHAWWEDTLNDDNERFRVDQYRANAKKQLESYEFRFLTAWAKLRGKDALSSIRIALELDKDEKPLY